MAQSDEARREYQRQWRANKLAEDPEYYRRYRRKWDKDNPDKVRKNQVRGRPRMIARAKERYHERIEEYRAKSREYAAQNPAKVRKWSRASYARNVEDRRQQNRERYRRDGRRNPDLDERGHWRTKQGLARWALNRAMFYGYIDKPDACEECGAKPGRRLIHGHHEDYDKPFIVEWICSTCHGRRHRRFP